MSFLALVHLNNLLRVDGQVLVGVYDDTEEPRVCLQDKEKIRQTFPTVCQTLNICDNSC